jgi:DNA polymerase III epsilon subunit-like protein
MQSHVIIRNMLKNKKYLVIDTETGGLNPEKNSILSVAGVLWEPGKTVEPIFDFYVKEHFINVEEAALKVNKIDMNKVHRADEPYIVVKKIQNSLNERLGSDRKAIQLVGHNVAFDIAFMKRLYKFAGLEDNFNKDFRSRAMDTCSILEFLMLSGKVDGFRASGDTLFKAGGVLVEEKDRHTALGDAMATANAMESLITKF